MRCLIRYRLRMLLIVVSLACILLSDCRLREYIPGTLRLGTPANPLPRGTGVMRLHYGSGKLMSTQWILAGVVRRITWYSPDGSVIATTWFNPIFGGTGYVLRQDGTIEVKAQMNYRPSDHWPMYHGDVVFCDANGKPVKTVRYHYGDEVKQ